MNKIVLLLAGSGLSSKEIDRYLREIVNMSDHELFSLIQELRGAPYMALPVHAEPDFRPAKQSKNDRIIAEQISQMLRIDAGLTVNQAGVLLLDALKRSLPLSVSSTLPSLNKESFQSWVQRLAAVVPASDLLHEAAKIRNKFALNTRSDWPLDKI